MKQDVAFLSRQAKDGWWPYKKGHGPSLEATVWCAIACRKEGELARKTAQFLLQSQTEEGGWSTLLGAGKPDWTSTLALLCLRILRQELLSSEGSMSQGGGSDSGNSDIVERINAGFARGLSFLNGFRSAVYNEISQVLLMLYHGRPDFDYPRGWPFTANTYHWVEPTSYALLALKGSMPGLDKRSLEMIEMADDYLDLQACRDGGWNYGCVKVFGVNLEAQPLTTAQALLALQDKPDKATVVKALAYLNGGLESRPEMQTLLSRAWSSLALDAMGHDVSQLTGKLAFALRSDGSYDDNLAASALASIAAGLPESGNPLKLRSGTE
jgi:hypothetical protein